MTTCQRYWREGILLVERGEPDPHRDTCLDCRRAHHDRNELVSVLPLVAAGHTGDPHWQMRVWRQIDQEQASRRPSIAWMPPPAVVYLGAGLSEASDGAPAGLLQRPRRVRPWLGRRLAWPAWLGLAVVVGMGLADTPKAIDCEMAAHTAGVAVTVCQRESEVALRREDRPLIAVQPVVRVSKLPETPCVRLQRLTHAAVLADPKGNLPEARHEAGAVSAMPHTRSAVSAAATATALFAAHREAVLHVAVHACIDAGGGVLELYDQEVSALEISTRGLGPSLVVLPACDAAATNGTDLASSLAGAFLAAGSTHAVIEASRAGDD